MILISSFPRLRLPLNSAWLGSVRLHRQHIIPHIVGFVKEGSRLHTGDLSEGRPSLEIETPAQGRRLRQDVV